VTSRNVNVDLSSDGEIEHVNNFLTVYVAGKNCTVRRDWDGYDRS